MQKLWGKVLAGEIKQPGSFSLRTMDTLKNISRDEAELFINVIQFAIKYNQTYFIMSENQIHSKIEFDEVSFKQLLDLQEIGLISAQTATLTPNNHWEVGTLFIYTVINFSLLNILMKDYVSKIHSKFTSLLGPASNYYL